jgi:hypothetical protein
MPVTPNLSLNQPVIGSNNWGGPLNYNFGQLDSFLSGVLPIPALNVTGNVNIGGTVTAGAFSGLDGATFLTSALYNVANGVPQLNSAGLIPASLLSNQGIQTVAFVPTPTFNAATAGSFKMTLTGNVTSSTYANGVQGASVVAFRIIQDGVGGRTFVWPSNVRNAGIISPGANSRSLQLFAVDTDGSLDAVGPMTYS